MKHTLEMFFFFFFSKNDERTRRFKHNKQIAIRYKFFDWKKNFKTELDNSEVRL